MRVVDKRNSLKVHKSKRYKRRNKSSIKKIAIHHSLTETGSAEAFARYHVENNDWPGIAYHYVIDQDGTVTICNDLELISYHVGNSNSFSVGICLVGDFRTQKISNEQRTAAIELTRSLMKELNLKESDVMGHQEFTGYSWKDCPSIDMKAFRNDLEPKASVKYKDQEVEAIIIDGRTYVQVRDFANLLNLNIGWDQQTKTVTLK